MAKKAKGGKKKAPAKKAAKRGAKPSTRRAPARQGVLPGHEQVRNVRLDRLCESIGNVREQTNALKKEEKGDLQAALREMHDKDVVVYRHMGVELVRVPGEEKLRVRTTKESASDITEGTDGDAGQGGDDDVHDNTGEID